MIVNLKKKIVSTRTNIFNIKFKLMKKCIKNMFLYVCGIKEIVFFLTVAYFLYANFYFVLGYTTIRITKYVFMKIMNYRK